MDDSPRTVGDPAVHPAREAGVAPVVGEPPGSLRQSAVRGVLWTSLEKWAVRISTFVAFVLLGRLLEPDEFGVVALAMVFITLLTVVTDAGFSTYLVQARRIDQATTSTAFYISLALGVVLTAVLVSISAPLAAAFDSPALALVLPAVSLAVLIAGASSVPAALLVRELRFRELAMRQVIATLLSVVVAVALAFGGAGVWALVAQNVVRSAVACIVLWWTTDFRPRLVFSRSEAGAMTRFGSSALLVHLGQQVRDQGESLLVGTFAGTTALGFWTVARRFVGVVVDLFSSVVNVVAQPVFAKVQDDRARLGRALGTSSAAGALLLAPVLFALALLSPVLVPVVFGDQWKPAAAVAAVLAVRSLVLSLSDFQRSVLLGTGRPGVELALTSVLLLGQVVVIVTVVDSGLVELAWWLTAWMALAWPLRAVVLWRVVGVGLRAYSQTSLVLVAAGAASALVLALAASFDLDVTGHVLVGLAGVLTYAGLVLLLCRGTVRQLLGPLGAMVRRRLRRAA